MPLLQAKGLNKSYNDTAVLNNAELSVEAGEVVSLVGPSGSGKSTLLHILGLLDKPTKGGVILEGNNITALNSKEQNKIRLKSLGYVYQFHYLLQEFSILENAAFPLLLAGVPKEQANKQALDLLIKLGLEERATHLPSTVSGGEQQRAAIARSLVHNPKLVLADEPTGNLDEENAQKVFDLFLSIAKQQNTSIVLATHNLALAKRGDRIFKLNKGQLMEWHNG